MPDWTWSIGRLAADERDGVGCEILIDPNPMVGVLGLTDSHGVARFDLPVPTMSGWWIDTRFSAQGIVEDPASPLSGLSLTQGLF